MRDGARRRSLDADAERAQARDRGRDVGARRQMGDRGHALRNAPSMT